MKSFTKSVLLVLVLLLAVVPLTMAQSGTATDVVVADGRFDTLEAAVVAAGLADTLAGGEWTVFAPTDEAFAKLGLNEDNIDEQFTSVELADLLLYHVLTGDQSTALLKGMLGDVTMANGQLAGLKFYEDDIYVNDDAKVIEPDVIVANGRIHVVDNVILPPWPRVAEEAVDEAADDVENVVEMAIAGVETEIEQAAQEVQEEVAEAVVDTVPAAIPDNSIAGVAVADGRFDTLAAAVVASGLADDLAGGEWTAFAPTDDAFAKLGLNASNVADEFSQAELADLLLYHVLSESKSIAELKTMLGNVVMANGQQAGLKFYEDHLYVNDDAMVIQENIITDNGTIHVVDNVILPPWPRE